MKEILDLLGCDGKIIFEHYKCYSEIYIWCILERHRCSSFTNDLQDQKIPISIMSHGIDQNKVLKDAVELLKKLKDLEKKISIPIPSLENQICNGGYYREFVLDDVEIEYRRKDKEFVITGINRKTKDGWYIVETPYPLSSLPGEISHITTLVNENNELLELYQWNDIQYLSGTSGEAIIKDGKVIRTKMTSIS